MNKKILLLGFICFWAMLPYSSYAQDEPGETLLIYFNGSGKDLGHQLRQFATKIKADKQIYVSGVGADTDINWTTFNENNIYWSGGNEIISSRLVFDLGIPTVKETHLHIFKNDNHGADPDKYIYGLNREYDGSTVGGYDGDDSKYAALDVLETIERYDLKDFDKIVISGHSRGSAVGISSFLYGLLFADNITDPDFAAYQSTVQELFGNVSTINVVALDPVAGPTNDYHMGDNWDTDEIYSWAKNRFTNATVTFSEVYANSAKMVEVGEGGFVTGAIGVDVSFNPAYRYLRGTAESLDVHRYWLGFRHSSMVNYNEKLFELYTSERPFDLMADYLNAAVEDQELFRTFIHWKDLFVENDYKAYKTAEIISPSYTNSLLCHPSLPDPYCEIDIFFPKRHGLVNSSLLTFVDLEEYIGYKGIDEPCSPDLPIATSEGIHIAEKITWDEATGWTHYCDCEGKLLLSIDWFHPEEEIEVSVNISSPLASHVETGGASGQVDNVYGVNVINRTWQTSIDPYLSPSQLVRLYFTHQEYEAANATLSFPLSTPDQLWTYSTFDNNAHLGFNDSGASEIYTSGGWNLGAHRENDYYAEISPAVITGGGIGAGEGGTGPECVAPAAICNDHTIYLDNDGIATLAYTDINTGTIATCGIQSELLSQSTFTCDDIGTPIPVTYTITDNKGQSDYCTTNITVIDDIAPNAICKDLSIAITTGTSVSIQAEDLNNGSSDNCSSPLTYEADKTIFTCGMLDAAVSVTLSVTDASGNTNTCTSSIMVEDQVDPIINCPNTLEVAIDENCAITIPDLTLIANATDNCGAFELTDFEPTYEGPRPASVANTAVFVDLAWYTWSSIPYYVYEFTVPTNGLYTLTYGSGSSAINGILPISANDYNSDLITATMPMFAATGGGSPNPATITLEAATPYIYITQAPSPIFPISLVRVENPGLDITQSLNANTTMEAVHDSPITLTLSTMDMSGNTAFCDVLITPKDYTLPAISCVPSINLTLEEESATITPAQLDNGTSDNCGFTLSLDKETFNCNDTGMNYVTLTATDDAGNQNFCYPIVNIIDNTAPVASCITGNVYIEANGAYDLQLEDVVDLDNTTDHCGIANILFEELTFDCNDVGTTVLVAVSVEDPSENMSTCIANITIEIDDSLPADWTSGDIGATTGAAGNYSFDPCSNNNNNNGSIEGEFNISGSGNNAFPGTTEDAIAYAYQTICGDVEITAKIESVSSNAYGGLMIREDDTPGAKQVSLFSNLSNALRHEVRYFTGANKVVQAHVRPAPYWLRLKREGNWVYAYYSSTGVFFQYVHAVYLPMSDCIDVGLASFTIIPGQMGDASFSNVMINTAGDNQAGAIDNPIIINTPVTINTELYPNPANNHITIRFSEALSQDTKLVLRNQLGQIVTQQIGKAGISSQEWPIEQLENGVYYIDIIQNKHREVLQFVKMRP